MATAALTASVTRVARDVHAYDTDGEDTTFEGRTASFFGGMFNDLFKTWGCGNLPEPPAEAHIDVEPTLETSSEITEQREQNDAGISSAEPRRDKANGQITDGAKKESFGKMFIYRLYIKWKWMQQRFERIGDMDRAADCFYHRLRLTKLYIYQPGWRIMDYGDMKPIFFPRQRIK